MESSKKYSLCKRCKKNYHNKNYDYCYTCNNEIFKECKCGKKFNSELYKMCYTCSNDEFKKSQQERIKKMHEKLELLDD